MNKFYGSSTAKSDLRPPLLHGKRILRQRRIFSFFHENLPDSIFHNGR